MLSVNFTPEYLSPAVQYAVSLCTGVHYYSILQWLVLTVGDLAS
jgi:hypothetical protein